MSGFALVGHIYRCQACGARQTVEVGEFPTYLICFHAEPRCACPLPKHLVGCPLGEHNVSSEVVE